MAGLITLAGFVVGDAETLLVRYRAMLILSGVLFFGWIGVACIDLFYYRQLLQGSVDAILALEKQGARNLIEYADRKQSRAWQQDRAVVIPGSGLIPLLGIIGWSVFQLSALPTDDFGPSAFQH